MEQAGAIPNPHHLGKSTLVDYEYNKYSIVIIPQNPEEKVAYPFFLTFSVLLKVAFSFFYN